MHMIVHFTPDRDRSRVHYQQFHNIFLYLIDSCQLRCGHCYMGDRLERGLSLSLQEAKDIIRACRRLGAEYITFLGGEPTLYRDLAHVVAFANESGFKQVMIDTNGLQPAHIFSIPPEQLYYVTVSLDGATPHSHDKVRGKGPFTRTVASMKEMVARGYRVRINSTVFRFSLHEAPAMLQLATEIGVKLVNFHTFSEEGLGIGKAWSVTPREWVTFCESLRRINGDFPVSVWYPPTWAPRSLLPTYVGEGFRGCLGCSLDRLSIFPDGRCYLCSVLFDRAAHFATITSQGLVLNPENNEYHHFTQAMASARESWLSGCPAERVLAEQGMPPPDRKLVSMCRCWKSQL